MWPQAEVAGAAKRRMPGPLRARRCTHIQAGGAQELLDRRAGRGGEGGAHAQNRSARIPTLSPPTVRVQAKGWADADSRPTFKVAFGSFDPATSPECPLVS